MKTRDVPSPGKMLADLVDRVSHRGGQTLRIMAEANVTLQQVLLLTRLRREGPCSVSELAVSLNLSLPAISQAVDRLMSSELVSRIEDPVDRRKKQLATTERANNLLDRLDTARASEYGAGLSALSAEMRQELATAIRAALRQLR
jgi:DNA-binding MarR family transcriptional regulator